MKYVRICLQAVNSYQSGGACTANVDSAVTAVEAAVEAISSAAEAPTPTSVQAALDSANTARKS